MIMFIHDYLFLRALLPDLLSFAYIPANHLKVKDTSQQPHLRRDIFTDYATKPYDEDEHVLVLEMDDKMVRRKYKLHPDSQVSLGIGPIF